MHDNGRVFLALKDLHYKLVRVQHHEEVYSRSLTMNVTPKGLHLKKKAFWTKVSRRFEEEWRGILRDAERSLMLLLKNEARNIQKDLVEDYEGRILRLMRERGKTLVEGWVRSLDIKEGYLYKELERRRRKRLDVWLLSFGWTPRCV